MFYLLDEPGHACVKCGSHERVEYVTADEDTYCDGCAKRATSIWEQKHRNEFLKYIGLWTPVGASQGMTRSSWIHPRLLVDHSWETSCHDRIVDYLSKGVVLHAPDGYSSCRFGCGLNGSTELTDGIWLWPEGLRHYVVEHHVRLPAEFVNHMQSNDFLVPSIAVDERFQLMLAHRSTTFWSDWCQEQADGAEEYRD